MSLISDDWAVRGWHKNVLKTSPWRNGSSQVSYASPEIVTPSDWWAMGRGCHECLSGDVEPTCHIPDVQMQVAQLVLRGDLVVASCQAQTGENVSVSVSRAPSPAASLAADAFVMLAWPYSAQAIEFATKGWYRRRARLGLHSASKKVSGTGRLSRNKSL